MSEISQVEHCQSCVLGVLYVSKWERLWRVTVWRPVALNFAACFESLRREKFWTTRAVVVLSV